MSDALQIEALHTGYRGRPVITDFNLGPISAGTITAVVGPNAAGKSTLLLALAGLLKARGDVKLGGVNLLGMNYRDRSALLSFMPQSLPQGVALTVFESLLVALKAVPLAERDGHHDRAVSMATLERLGIADLAGEQLDRLSGGQRQLVSLAQAIVRQPKVLLLDEPTSALDLRHQETVMEIVTRLAREGQTILLVLHDLNLAARWSDNIALLHGGKLKAFGSPAKTITEANLAEVYGVRTRIQSPPLQIVVTGKV